MEERMLVVVVSSPVLVPLVCTTGLAQEIRAATRCRQALPALIIELAILRPIPDWHGDVKRFERVQGLSDGVAVDDARPAADPFSNRKCVIIAVERVDVRKAVARRAQTLEKRLFAVSACPGQPTEVARTGAEDNISDHIPGYRMLQRFGTQGDGKERAATGCPIVVSPVVLIVSAVVDLSPRLRSRREGWLCVRGNE
jgi:hypothetical protein